MESSTLTAPLDASVFDNFSIGWLEKLSNEDLQILEAELQETVDQHYKVRANVEQEQQAEVDAKCQASPLYWLQNYTATENPLYEEQGLPFRAPFPRKSYFEPLFSAFGEYKRLFIPKTRDMLTSWCVMGDSAHRAQWQHWFVVVQTDSEKKAKQLINYVRILYDNQPEWLRARHSLDGQPSDNEIRWKTSGRVLAIPSGENKIRLYHPTRYVMDEAAFLPEAEQCYNAAYPVAGQIIGVSSAGPGWFGDECSL